MVCGNPARVSGAAVLLVEDEPDCRLVIQRLLLGRGWRVFGARNGAEAAALLDVTQPDVVMTDIAMRGVDGIELARYLKVHAPGIPVIVFTGLPANDPRIGEIHAIGCAELLHKPVSSEDLEACLARVLEARGSNPD